MLRTTSAKKAIERIRRLWSEKIRCGRPNYTMHCPGASSHQTVFGYEVETVERHKFMNFVIIMNCCQVLAALVFGFTKLTKFPFATSPSHNYLLIVYIMLMVPAASHLLLHLCVYFICIIFFSFCLILLPLNYCSPKAINFGSCEPNSRTATNEWSTQNEKKKWNEVRSLTATASAMASMVCSGCEFSLFFFASLGPNKSPSPLAVIYAELFIHVNACVARCNIRSEYYYVWWVRVCACVLPSENNK